MKKITKLLLPLILVIALFFGIKTLTNPKAEVGSKSVVINVKVKQEDESIDVIKELEFKTDAETVGDALDEINQKLIDVELEGDKDSEYGRFIAAIESYKTEDMAKGPWWMIYSDTNKDCLDAGFCSGVDLQNIYNEDIFDLVFE